MDPTANLSSNLNFRTVENRVDFTTVIDGEPKHFFGAGGAFWTLETASTGHVFSAIHQLSSSNQSLDTQDVNVQGQLGNRSANALAADQVGDDFLARVMLVDHGRSTSEDEAEHGGHFHYYGVEGTEPPPPPNVPPRITTSVTTYNLPINAGAAANVGTFTATDADAEPDDTLTWSVSGTDAANFAIGADTGVLTTAAALTNGQTYNLNVNVSDGRDTTSLAIMVVVAVNHAPVVTTSTAAIELQYNTPRGRQVIDFEATDENVGDVLSWRITDFSGAGGNIPFAIDPRTGVVTTTAVLSVARSYRPRVFVTDEGGLSTEVSFLITVLEEGANIAPRFTTTTTAYTLVRPNVNDVVARLNAVDDNNHALTYTLTGTNAALFAIGASTGIVTVARALTRGQSYTFMAVVTDTEGATATLNLRVNVVDNRTPTFSTSVTSYQVFASSPIGTYLTRIVGNDLDGDTLTYTLSGAGASNFQINGSTGDLTTAATLVVGSVYQVTVGVSDGIASATLALTITAVAMPVAPVSPVGAGEPQIDGLHEFREVFDMVSPGMGDTISRIRQTNFQAIRQTALSLGTRISGEFTLQERLNEVEIIPIYPLENVRIGDVLYVRQPQGDLSVGDPLPIEHFQIIGVVSVADSKRQALVCEGFPK